LLLDRIEPAILAEQLEQHARFAAARGVVLRHRTLGEALRDPCRDVAGEDDVTILEERADRRRIGNRSPRAHERRVRPSVAPAGRGPPRTLRGSGDGAPAPPARAPRARAPARASCAPRARAPAW